MYCNILKSEILNNRGCRCKILLMNIKSHCYTFVSSLLCEISRSCLIKIFLLLLGQCSYFSPFLFYRTRARYCIYTVAIVTHVAQQIDDPRVHHHE